MRDSFEGVTFASGMKDALERANAPHVAIASANCHHAMSLGHISLVVDSPLLPGLATAPP